MDGSNNSKMDDQVEEFSRKMHKLSAFYRREALIAGVMRAKQDLDTLNSAPQDHVYDGTYNDTDDNAHILTPQRAKQIVASAATRALNLIRGLNNNQNRPHQSPHSTTIHPDSQPYPEEVIENGE